MLPYNHTYESVSDLLVSFHHHSTLCINESLRAILNNLKTYHPDYIYIVPAIAEKFYTRIIKEIEAKGKKKQFDSAIKLSNGLRKVGIDRRKKIFSFLHEIFGGNLRKIVCGGAPIRAEVGEFFDNIGISLINGYGITECSPAVTCNRPGKCKPGSVGVPMDCCQIKIHNPDDEGVGEIYVKGTNVMLGYYNEPEATAAAFDGEWFKTGDYGYIDSEGFLFIRGREKNLIILSNGKNVSPEELEDKLSRIEYVKEVLVYEENGFITAEMFLNEEDFPDARQRIKGDIDEFNRKMPLFKNIGKYKIRDDEFPKTTTLKIVRKYMQK